MRFSDDPLRAAAAKDKGIFSLPITTVYLDLQPRSIRFMRRLFPVFFLLLLGPYLSAQEKTDAWLKDLLWAHASDVLKNILQHPDSFRYQIIYTRIDRDRQNRPHFSQFYYRVNKEEYFNPASTVKLPLALLSLEKINDLHVTGLNKYSSMLTDSAYSRQTVAVHDSSAENGLPSLAQYIRKIFLVSDNDAYNRLYEFMGQETINRRLWEMGYPDIRITRRFTRMNTDENRHSNPMRFFDNNKLIYQQPPAVSQVPFDFSHTVLIGQGHYDQDDKLLLTPMDFTEHNNLPLEDLQQILQSALFPESVPAKKRFRLTAEDYSFLYQYMSEYPSESRYPHYDSTEYFNSYCKFFMYRAGKSAIPPYVRIFNKPGWSYGFLTDVAYIADFKNNVEFMLSAVIYVNRDGILNDDKYEYEETGWPFFKEIGNIIYQYELGRKRKYVPVLDSFKRQYR